MNLPPLILLRTRSFFANQLAEAVLPFPFSSRYILPPFSALDDDDDDDDESMEEVTPEMERIFKRFDANGDGKISLTELAEVLRTLGSTNADDVSHVMAEIDTDGDDNIDFKEFIAFCHANPGLVKDIAKVF